MNLLEFLGADKEPREGSPPNRQDTPNLFSSSLVACMLRCAESHCEKKGKLYNSLTLEHPRRKTVAKTSLERAPLQTAKKHLLLAVRMWKGYLSRRRRSTTRAPRPAIDSMRGSPGTSSLRKGREVGWPNP